MFTNHTYLVYEYKPNLALNNVLRLIYHETKPNLRKRPFDFISTCLNSNGYFLSHCHIWKTFQFFLFFNGVSTLVGNLMPKPSL